MERTREDERRSGERRAGQCSLAPEGSVESIASALWSKFVAIPRTYGPIILVIRHHEPDEVFELFRAADLCIVSSLHDGMNLVAKEFVAARDDE